MLTFVKIFSGHFLGPKAGDPVVTVTVSACPPGLTVQCGDRLLDSDHSEWARLGWGDPKGQLPQPGGQGGLLGRGVTKVNKTAWSAPPWNSVSLGAGTVSKSTR